jgi:hypothetical protein
MRRRFLNYRRALRPQFSRTVVRHPQVRQIVENAKPAMTSRPILSAPRGGSRWWNRWGRRECSWGW